MKTGSICKKYAYAVFFHFFCEKKLHFADKVLFCFKLKGFFYEKGKKYLDKRIFQGVGYALLFSA